MRKQPVRSVPSRLLRRYAPATALSLIALVGVARAAHHHDHGAPKAVVPPAAAAPDGAAPVAAAGVVKGTLVLSPDVRLPELPGAPTRFENGFLPIAPPVVDPRTDMVVYLDPGAATGPSTAPEQPASLQIIGSRLLPATFAVVPGTTISITNLDPGSHTLTTPDVPELLPPEPQQNGAVRKVLFKVAGSYALIDDEVPHVRGEIIVLPAPYFANPDGNGAFTIPNVPDGRYTLELLYRSGKPLYSEPVAVHGGAELTVKPPADLSGATQGS